MATQYEGVSAVLQLLLNRYKARLKFIDLLPVSDEMF